jgi:hypothetical protein
MTYWHTFIDFINTKPVGSIIKRSDLIKQAFPGYGEIPSYDGIMINRVDQFKWMLIRAGYLKRLKRGQFLLLNKVPEDITSEECIALVKKDNFTYIKCLDRRRKKRRKDAKQV